MITKITTALMIFCASATLAFAQKPELRLAIKDVTAWPNLQKLPDGSVLATIFNKPSHGQMEGDVDCWTSADGGVTWKHIGTPARHEPGTNRMNVAVGHAKNGDLIAICSGWSDKPVPGQKRVYDGPFREAILQSWVSRSNDGGRTWQVDKTAFPLDAPNGGWLIPYGDINIAANGDLLVSTYSARGPKSKFQVYFYRSRDDGRTWGDPVLMSPSVDCNETALLRLGGERWLAAGRGGDDNRGLHLFSSNDDGRTWKFLSQVTEDRRYPAHFLRLADGRLLLMHGNRTRHKGIDAVISSDEGATWSAPRRIADFEGDGGYPASVQLADGRILTAFYAKKTKVYDGYHMAVVTWTPPPPSKTKPQAR